MYKIHFFIFFLCFFSLIAGAQNPGNIVADNFEETAGRGLVIRSNPAGARVFINGVEYGLTPITLNSLAPGGYSISLVKENYTSRNFDVTLFSTGRLVVSIKMEQPQGQVQLSILKAEGSRAALPFNPQVSVSSFGSVALDDNYKAEINLPAGYYTFRAQAFGWEDTVMAVLVTEDSVPVNIVMNPALFKMENLSQSRSKINPMSQNETRLGTAEYRFEVTAPYSGFFNVIDNNGSIVFRKQLEYSDTRIQRFTWNGKDSFGNPLPEGIYTISVEAENTQLKIETEIDYSLNLFPLSLNNGISGLIFSPLPNTLPAGSFQIEADTYYGNFDSFTGFPFIFGIRVSPINKLETTVVFNLNPRNNDTGWGITGSIKYELVKNDFPVAFALGISYSYTNDTGEHPLSAGKGIGFYIPLSYNFSSGSLFSNTIVFSPGVFWHGPNDLTPFLLLSLGYLLEYKDIYSGLSVRAEIDFKDFSKFRIFAGAEVRLFPIPSGLYFSLQAGMWTQNSNLGGFGGLGIGVVY